MSGDHGLSTTVPAALAAVSVNANLHILLVGDKAQLEPLVAKSPHVDRITIVHSTEVVEMDEPPAQALRSKKDSSMRLAINAVKDGDAQACVSAGNTGALMATAKFVLKTMEGIDRPAICSRLPTLDGVVYMLDLGANVDSSPEHLKQFAVMGEQLCKALSDTASPRVALLNIGSEEIKGNELVKQSAELIAPLPINYVGFVEADEIFHGKTDVVVCDGFVGNVALKTLEGTAKMIAHFMRTEFNSSLISKASGLAAMPVLKRLGKRIDPRKYNGATFLGLKGAVIKSHGGADVVAFQNAIEIAMHEAELDVPKRISDAMSESKVTE